MMRVEVFPGDVFGRLTVIDGGHHAKPPFCRCVCGGERTFNVYNLIHGKSQSCGCLNREPDPTISEPHHVPGARRQHGHAGKRTPTYQTWTAMHQRCRPGHKAAPYYFDRGITVCERWRSFEAFLDDMGERPGGMTLDRIDNTKGYSPENCRWATWSTQMKNRRRSRPLWAQRVKELEAENAMLWKLLLEAGRVALANASHSNPQNPSNQAD